MVRRKNINAAMKVEVKTSKRKDSKLKMEIAVLKDITTSKHFTKIIDRGRKEDTKDRKAYFFIVMQLVGKSLNDLKNARPHKVFSIATALGVAHQCLEGVEEMHKHGYVHRDLKPQNYACGLGSEKHLIYILDFGIARKFLNTKNEVKTPREVVGFKGTVRFASIACHRGIEMGPKDDCESWFYMFIDFTNPAGLPWKKLNDKKEVLPVKLESWHGRTDNPLYGEMQNVNEIAKILGYVSQLQYQDKVDYSFIYKLLYEVNTSSHADEISIFRPGTPIELTSMRRTTGNQLTLLLQKRQLASKRRENKLLRDRM